MICISTLTNNIENRVLTSRNPYFTSLFWYIVFFIEQRKKGFHYHLENTNSISYKMRKRNKIFNFNCEYIAI